MAGLSSPGRVLVLVAGPAPPIPAPRYGKIDTGLGLAKASHFALNQRRVENPQRPPGPCGRRTIGRPRKLRGKGRLVELSSSFFSLFSPGYFAGQFLVSFFKGFYVVDLLLLQPLHSLGMPFQALQDFYLCRLSFAFPAHFQPTNYTAKPQKDEQ